LLGQGDPEIEAAFRMLSQTYPGRVSVRIGYSEDCAHRLHAGGDLLMHGSRFEPCGLTQLYAMRFGTLPIVRPVGGLADTIIHASEQAILDGTANGFCFDEATVDAMVGAVDHATGLYYRPPIWSGLQKTAMSIDFSWERSAQKYREVYDRVFPHARTGRPPHGEIPTSMLPPQALERSDPRFEERR
jgi:starch synthase